MSDVLSRPTLRRYDARQPSSVPLRQALLRALVAALVGYVVVAAIVLAAWGTDSRSAVSTLAAMRSIGSVWAFAHRTPLHVGSGSTALHLGLTPLGLLALPVALLAHGGVRLGRAVREVAGERARLRAAAELLATFVATYALLAGLIVASTSTSALHVARFSVIGWAALAALVAGGIGLGTAARLWPALTGYRLPAQVPVALRGAGAALAVVLSAGALLVAAALALATGRAADLAHGLGTGIPGGFLLAVLCVLYAPSAAVYASAYAVGTGFVIGSGTSVAASGAHVGVVPSFPLLAALPRGEHASAASTLVWA
ncbi:MAG: cell division protein PerM, partial [Mycobacteriales bacterium]